MMEHDEFSGKRSMVKKLLEMLKSNAVDEMSSHLESPEGMPKDAHGIQVEKVEMIPDHKMDEPTPEHDVVTHDLHTGGIVDKVSPIVPPTMDSEQGEPEKEGAAHEEATESKEERLAEGDTTPSMFDSFLRRKKK